MSRSQSFATSRNAIYDEGIIIQIIMNNMNKYTIKYIENEFNSETADEKIDAFWKELRKEQNRLTCLQSCLTHLEQYKRRLGREYDKLKLTHPTGWVTRLKAKTYNDVEYDIRYLVAQYGCKRTSKPYILEVK